VEEPGLPVGSAVASSDDVAGYQWNSAGPTCAHAYLWPAVRRVLAHGVTEGRAKRVFDLGCGNGATARLLAPKAGRSPGSILHRKA
jgi:hypothetical protein